MTSIVHLGGFVRSGAAAVRDALIDTGAFLAVKGAADGASESRLFSGSPSIPTFVGHAGPLAGVDILALWTAGTRVPDGAALGAATRRFLRRTAASHANNRKSFQTVATDRVLAAAEATAAAIARSDAPADRTDAYITGTYAAMRALLPTEGRNILVNNDPGATGQVAQQLRLDARSRFIAVVRDPSDQYVDRRLGVEPDEARPVNLVRAAASGVLRRRHLTAIAGIAATFPDRCLIVEFERFVSEPAYRERLVELAVDGATGRAIPARLRFDAARSMRNIGLTVPRRDALQHRVFTRLCDGPYRRAQERSGPDVWQEDGSTAGGA